MTTTISIAHAENLAVPYMPPSSAPYLVLVPDLLSSSFADFEFELTYRDTEQHFRFPKDSTAPWAKLFRDQVETILTFRTWYWKQVGSAENAHWCYYEIDQQNRTDYNYGLQLLDVLNADTGPTRKGRYIVNKLDERIISGSWLLKRENAVDGSVPWNDGNIIIDGVEHTYESIFG